MDTNSNYYDNYNYYLPTIAICIEKIDRLIDKKYKFTIPSLISTMKSDGEDKNEIKNQDTTSIINEGNIQINDITLDNYFEIYVPREVMAYTTSKAGLSGILYGIGTMTGDSINYDNINASTANMKTNITIPPHPTSSYTITSIAATAFRAISGAIKSFTGDLRATLDMKTNNKSEGITIEPNERYIDKGSEWVIMFINGDPTKPAIIARYK